jgi:hypothetical protein
METQAVKTYAEKRDEVAAKLIGTGYVATKVAALQTLDDTLMFLDELRESGVTNMFGAGSYVSDFLGLERNQKNIASIVLTFWMETFGERNAK